MNTPRIFLSPPDATGREQELVAEIFASNYLAPAGPMLERFEREFCDYVGLAHAVAVSSGTAALHLGLRILGVGPGDGVITSTLTFMGGVAPIVYQGAQPIFVDVEPDDWCLDPSLIAPAVRQAEQAGLKVRAVIPTDLYGQCAAIDEIRSICDPLGIPVLLDSAEGVGSLYKDLHAGHGAVASDYSFNGNKIITTSGGGMLASDDGAFIEQARYLSTAARQPYPHYEHTEVGFNYRMSSLSAALGVGQLEMIEAKVAKRRAIFDRYRQNLDGLPGLSFATEGENRRHTRWLTVMLVKSEIFGASVDAVINSLAEENIEARRVWKPMHMQPVFVNALRIKGEVAEGIFNQGVCLPSGSSLLLSDVDRISGIVERGFTSRTA